MRLTLRREALSALTPAELGSVAGGQAPTQPVDECLSILTPPTTPVQYCVSGHTCIDCLTRWC